MSIQIKCLLVIHHKEIMGSATVVRRAWCGSRKQSREQLQEGVRTRHSSANTDFQNRCVTPVIFLASGHGGFFLTLLKATKEIKDIIIPQGARLRLELAAEFAMRRGSGFENMWGSPSRFVPYSTEPTDKRGNLSQEMTGAVREGTATKWASSMFSSTRPSSCS